MKFSFAPDTKTNNAIMHLFSTYREGGYECYLVGGAVRDMKAGQTPKDFDFATNAPYEFTKSSFGKTIDTGIAHGTITVVIDGNQFEVTRFRTDLNHDGRHCEINFATTIEEDLSRRDFRFNAMAMTFDGELIDPFGGEQDLKNGIVRFVGNPTARIQEDYLRILRWFRFLGRYGDMDNIDIQTRAAIRENASGLKNISSERIWSEVQRIIVLERGTKLMSLMITLGPLFYTQLPTGYPWSLTSAKSITDNPELLIAAWLNWNHRDVQAVATHWKWSRAETDHAIWMCANIYQERDLRRLLVIENVRQPWVVELAALEDRNAWEQNALANWVFPTFPVTGVDLIALGIKPGMALGVMLRDLKEHWFTTGCSWDREELLATIKTV